MNGYGNGVGAFRDTPKYDNEVNMLAKPLDQPQRPPMLQQELAGTEQRIEALHGALSQLESRLSEATRPEPPSPATTTPHGREHPGVQLVGYVMQHNARIEHAISRVQSLLTRLEI